MSCGVGAAGVAPCAMPVMPFIGAAPSPSKEEIERYRAEELERRKAKARKREEKRRIERERKAALELSQPNKAQRISKKSKVKSFLRLNKLQDHVEKAQEREDRKLLGLDKPQAQDEGPDEELRKAVEGVVSGDRSPQGDRKKPTTQS